ncbi:MAG: uroporphyrinogen decarboxylase [Deltaproteobacteria bacterium]|jgi:uroporphyrinogen decarboxylase|nr:uroporphyrinogen decarboxylase [Deltaproteobacteria bacterium]
MTDRELVEKVLNCESVERVPVGFWFHFLADAETGNGLSDHTILERNVQGHREYLTGFGPDLVKIMSDGYFTYPLADGAMDIREIGDLGALEAIGKGHVWIRDQVRLVQEVRAIKPGTFYFYNVFSPATTLRFMIGRPRLLEWLGRDRRAVLGAISRIGEGLKALSQAVIREGQADGLYLSVQNPDQGRLGDGFYLEHLAPGELDILEGANKAKGRSILHICGYGGVRNNLAVYRDFPANVFSWAANVEEVSLGQGRRLFGGRPVLGGFPNTSGSLLQTGDRRAIEDFTRRLLEEAGREGVIIGADCTIPQGIPYERLEWVRHAARR